MNGLFKRKLEEMRTRRATEKALHLQQIEEVKQEMQNIKPSKSVKPTPKIRETYVPPMSPAGFAMTIRLRKDAKPILKNSKKV